MSRGNMKGIVNFIAFVGLILIALSLILTKLIPSVATACALIANIIAYTMVAFSSFYFVRNRSNIAYLIIWIVCIVLVVVMMIL